MRKIIINILLLYIIGCMPVFAQQEPQQSKWHGFVKHSFVFNGKQAHIVAPQQALPGNPWVWRAYFPDWHTDMDSILLSRGFHIAYVDCGDMFGSAEAMQVWEKFYDYLTREKQFAEKPALEGVSRGGLYVYAWAKRNPGKVSCIYAEAPVLDIKSWPGGKGKGRGSGADWQKLFKAYHFTEEEAMAFPDNPVDHLETLAAFKVPVVHVVCERDSIVPLAENTAILEKNYRKYGGNIRVDYMTEGVNDVGHHFTIKDPEQYADFIFNHTVPLKQTLSNEKFVHSYGSLNNMFYHVKEKKELTVAFLGGSITQNPGWKDKTARYLQEVYPQTQFHFIYAGIASLGSVPHAFRLQTDVLNKGKVDLLFVEAAVNDLANKTPAAQQQQAMEGIIRHALSANPYMNIVLMAFADEDKTRGYENGRVPAEVALHEQMANYYKLGFLNLAQEVQQRIASKEFTWKD
ncbi:MAG TPA: SGNH/GDSL hydrolase family protein, partial [Agriterribacter sp.]|nr:SGNH/GDSL hydrolase family protein [Agriterribacter sp.]